MQMPLALLRRLRGHGNSFPREPGDPELTAYSLELQPAMRLVPAPSGRTWMTETPNRFAYRCLPLLIANQAGWLLLNRHAVRATWNGSDALDGVAVEPLGERLPTVRSHFGSGILTWNLPFLFRTSPGYNLLVRGPANWPKDGACPLEGLVETDWSPATFTMNWKLTRPHFPVVFEEDEPICMIVPQRRGELEAFRHGRGTCYGRRRWLVRTSAGRSAAPISLPSLGRRAPRHAGKAGNATT
jgi:hypothetical protein